MVHQYTCNTLPLDNSKIYSHPALPYITWGLIQDSKIKKKESLALKFSTGQVSEILKRKKRSQLKIFHIAGKSTFQIQTAYECFEVANSARRERSPIHGRIIILPLPFKNHQIQASGMSSNFQDT